LYQVDEILLKGLRVEFGVKKGERESILTPKLISKIHTEITRAEHKFRRIKEKRGIN